jgi:hypothetical protein
MAKWLPRWLKELAAFNGADLFSLPSACIGQQPKGAKRFQPLAIGVTTSEYLYQVARLSGLRPTALNGHCVLTEAENIGRTWKSILWIYIDLLTDLVIVDDWVRLINKDTNGSR